MEDTLSLCVNFGSGCENRTHPLSLWVSVSIPIKPPQTSYKQNWISRRVRLSTFVLRLGDGVSFTDSKLLRFLHRFSLILSPQEHTYDKCKARFCRLVRPFIIRKSSYLISHKPSGVSRKKHTNKIRSSCQDVFLNGGTPRDRTVTLCSSGKRADQLHQSSIKSDPKCPD